MSSKIPYYKLWLFLLCANCGRTINSETQISFSLSGTVTGLKNSLQLKNGGEVIEISRDGQFIFPGLLKDGEVYDITINKSSGQQLCRISNGKGVIANANISNIEVNCADKRFALAGYILRAGKHLSGYWLDGIWHPLSEQCDAKSIASDGADIYVSGTCTKSSTVTEAGYWKNGSWVAINIPNATSATANILAINNHKPYVSVSGVDNAQKALPGYSVDGDWTTLKSPYDNPVALDLLWLANDFIIAGYHSNTNQAGFWSNDSWNDFSSVTGSLSILVGAGLLDNSVIYAGYIRSGSKLMVGYWLNNVFKEIGTGIATGLSVTTDEIFISGSNTIDDITAKLPGYWLNGTWTELPKPSGKNNLTVSLIKALGDDLYVIGNWINDDREGSGYWKNAVWTDIAELSSSGGKVLGINFLDPEPSN